MGAAKLYDPELLGVWDESEGHYKKVANNETK